MDYESYILPAYGLTFVLLGGLICFTWLAARQVRRALGKGDA